MSLYSIQTINLDIVSNVGYMSPWGIQSIPKAS